MRRSRLFASGLATVALTATVVAGLPASATPSSVDTTAAAAVAPLVSPAEDPFYQPPNPIPNVPPGTVLRSRPATVTIVGLPIPVRAWTILYRSTDTHGAPNAVSGTVLVPYLPHLGGPRPLIEYNVGTHGLGPTCAPSYQLRQGIDFEAPLISLALARNWAVVVTDYEGSGTPGPHTYGSGLATGRAALDSARAALRLPEAGLPASTPIGIWGYSEGGLASSWATELAPGYAPELNLKGTAAGGVPAKLRQVLDKVNGGPFFGAFIAAVAGINRAYPELDIPSVLNDKGRAALQRVGTQCQTQFFAEFAFHRFEEYTDVPDPLSLPRFAKVIADNSLPQRVPRVPVKIYESVFDELIPIDGVRQLVGSYCASGVTVHYREDLLSDHISLAATAAPEAVAWLADRFAGRRAPSTC